MKTTKLLLGTTVCAMLVGCARLEFEDGGLAYFEPIPYYLVTTTDKCVISGSVVLIPGERKMVKLKPGFGSSELSVSLSNGMITSVGQKTDTKVSETITSLAALGTAVAALDATTGEPKACPPSAMLFPIEKGSVRTDRGTPIPTVLPGDA